MKQQVQDNLVSLFFKYSCKNGVVGAGGEYWKDIHQKNLQWSDLS